jgi:hypothetical protein
MAWYFPTISAPGGTASMGTGVVGGTAGTAGGTGAPSLGTDSLSLTPRASDASACAATASPDHSLTSHFLATPHGSPGSPTGPYLVGPSCIAAGGGTSCTAGAGALGTAAGTGSPAARPPVTPCSSHFGSTGTASAPAVLPGPHSTAPALLHGHAPPLHAACVLDSHGRMTPHGSTAAVTAAGGPPAPAVLKNTSSTTPLTTSTTPGAHADPAKDHASRGDHAAGEIMSMMEVETDVMTATPTRLWRGPGGIWHRQRPARLVILLSDGRIDHYQVGFWWGISDALLVLSKQGGCWVLVASTRWVRAVIGGFGREAVLVTTIPGPRSVASGSSARAVQAPGVDPCRGRSLYCIVWSFSTSNSTLTELTTSGSPG